MTLPICDRPAQKTVVKLTPLKPKIDEIRYQYRQHPVSFVGWAAKVAWVFVQSLMGRVLEPRRFACWIAPPPLNLFDGVTVGRQGIQPIKVEQFRHESRAIN